MTDKKRAGSDVRERLQEAAVRMFRNDGYEKVTAAQIAASVGVTERTFFRYFPDKREVLFGREEMVRDSVLAGIRDAPAALGPVDMLFHAYEAFRGVVEERRSFAEPRQEVIDTHPALQERELTKIAALADAIAGGLEARGVPALHAALAARIGMVAIAQATSEWLADGAVSLKERFEEARRTLRQLAS